MPELTLGGGEGGVDAGGDHVFDAEETGVGGRGVVEEALADVWGGGVSGVENSAAWRRRAVNVQRTSDKMDDDGEIGRWTWESQGQDEPSFKWLQ